LNPNRSARARWAISAISLWAGTWTAAAGEAASRAKDASTEKPDTIEAAREELRQLQVGRETSHSNQTALPRLSAPEWHGGSTPAVPAVTPRPKSAPDAKNANWLVEAMRKPGDASAQSRGRDGRNEGTEPGLLSRSASAWEQVDERGGTAREPNASSERDATRARPAAAGAAVNPLASFLDDWMSPQDYALLQPELAASRTSQVGLPTPPHGFGPALTDRPGFPSLAGNAPPVTALSGAGGLGAPRENPFLQALEPSIAKFPSSVPLPRPVASLPGPAPLPTPAATPVSPLPSPRVPELVRPVADEKHFKPLKRF